MGLADEIALRMATAKTSGCRVHAVAAQLSDEDRVAWLRLVADRTVLTSVLAAVMAERQLSIAESTIRLWRRQGCRCESR